MKFFFLQYRDINKNLHFILVNYLNLLLVMEYL